MMAFRRFKKSRTPAPLTEYEEIGQRLALPKKFRDREDGEQIDTRDLPLRKIHPEREPEFLTWLRFRPCSIAGREDSLTGSMPVCWSPESLGPGRYLSDPAHTGKAYSGRLKRTDRGAFPLCRHAHRLQESQMDRFDLRYGINRHEIAAEMWKRFSEEH